MNKETQIPILQRELQIPVNNVIFNETYNYVEIISGNTNIGNIPYILTLGNLMYDKDPSNANRLKWDQIYIHNQDVIHTVIKEVIGREDIQITILTFRRLNIKEELTGNDICNVTCSYSGKWDIYIEK